MCYLDFNFFSSNLSRIETEWLKWTASRRGSVGVEFHNVFGIVDLLSALHPLVLGKLTHKSVQLLRLIHSFFYVVNLKSENLTRLNLAHWWKFSNDVALLLDQIFGYRLGQRKGRVHWGINE